MVLVRISSIKNEQTTKILCILFSKVRICYLLSSSWVSITSPRPKFASQLSSPFTVQGALRAKDTAKPPLNMRHSIEFNGILVFAVALLVFFLRGRQTRRELDEQMHMQQLSPISPHQPGGGPPTTL